MDQWEYLSIFLEADTKDKQVKQFVEQTFDKKVRRHSPEALIPELNKLGSEGWEIIHMEPIPRVSGRESVKLDPYRWTSTYFCVLKRATGEPEPVTEVQSVTAQAAPQEPEVETPAMALDPNRIPY